MDCTPDNAINLPSSLFCVISAMRRGKVLICKELHRGVVISSDTRFRVKVMLRWPSSLYKR